MSKAGLLEETGNRSENCLRGSFANLPHSLVSRNANGRGENAVELPAVEVAAVHENGINASRVAYSERRFPSSITKSASFPAGTVPSVLSRWNLREDPIAAARITAAGDSPPRRAVRVHGEARPLDRVWLISAGAGKNRHGCQVYVAGPCSASE